MVRRAMFAAAAVGAAALAGRVRELAAQQPRTVTLQEALDLAARDQPAMVTARQNVRIAEAAERQAVAAFLPNVTSTLSTGTSGGSRVSQFGTPTALPSYYTSNFGITANWNVFTGFQRGAQRSAAQATDAQREATLLQQQYATALATKQAFFLALEDAELVGVQQTQVRLTTEQVKLVSEKLRLGATTRSDSLTAEVTAANAQLALINAQNNLSIAQANLGRAIQLPGLVMAVPDSNLESRITALDTAALLADAMVNAPSVAQATAAENAARAMVGVNRAAFFPQASVSVGNTWAAGLPPSKDSLGNTIPGTGTTGPFSGSYASGWNARLTITYPLFNNLNRETNYLTADANLQSAVAATRDARLALQASLLQNLSVLSSAATSIDVSRASVAAAEEAMRMQTERYRLGAVTIIDVLTAQANLQQAQVNLVTARYNYLVAHAQLEALVGHNL